LATYEVAKATNHKTNISYPVILSELDCARKIFFNTQLYTCYNNSMIKAVLFDLDDTLIKTSETKYEALKCAANHFYRLELTTEMIHTHWGKPYKQFMKDLFGEIDTVESIINNYYSIRGKFPSPAYESAVSVVEELSNSYFVGLVTATTKQLVKDDLASAGFKMSSFSYIQTSEKTTVHKPNPSVFKPILIILSEKNISPAEIVYVGDSPADCKAARGAGFHFIGLVNRTSKKEDFEDSIHTITHFSQLPKMIQSIS
jgi:phosphoglycolate phosphatase